jgi:hypothetical protein
MGTPRSRVIHVFLTKAIIASEEIGVERQNLLGLKIGAGCVLACRYSLAIPLLYRLFGEYASTA